jgi:hypothetical protein
VDTQQTEIIARNLLVSWLVADGLEVARPERDRGVDLIAYLDLADAGSFRAVPIQLKSASRSGFGIDRKYERTAGLLMAHVWHIADATRVCAFALSHQESVAIGETMGWTTTASWLEHGAYSTRSPSGRLLEQLEPYRMEPGDWRKKVEGLTLA